MYLEKEDYQEPRCPFEMPKEEDAPAGGIPVRRIIEKVDEELSRNDHAGAERVLKYWLSEAEACRDERGAFSVNNELMGLYRKLGRRDEALERASEALRLLKSLGYEESVSGATCYINSATVYKAFGMAEEALPLFEKARAVFEKHLKNDDTRMGGLYNNMALALVDLGRFEEAEDLYFKAIAVMERNEGSGPEQAISWLNLASAAEARLGIYEGEEQISDCVARAWELLDKEQARNGNYAFVCGKCAPVFGYYGYFMYEDELNERAKSIYERS